SHANDLTFWVTSFKVDSLAALESGLRQAGTRTVSAQAVNLHLSEASASEALIVRDPDGHAVRLQQDVSAGRPLAAR
ncbi:MAG TPA: hypothetical protein VHI52_22475, partial [Verrucomicrobiae bacterium]|nr:hypothetical protein [Verrucomicrobiae bacterium]